MKRLSSFVTIVLLLLAIIAGSLCKQWLTAENQKVQSNAGVGLPGADPEPGICAASQSLPNREAQCGN